MTFQLSAGVNVSEIDLTNVVPAVATTEGAIAGIFRWGPVNERTLVSSESELAARFGKPTSLNPETFFTAADFLAYGNKLFVSRVTSATAKNAGANALIKSVDEALAHTGVDFIAKYPGDLGNSLEVSVCPTAAAFQVDDLNLDLVVGSNTGTTSAGPSVKSGDIMRVGNNSIGFQELTITNIVSTTISFETTYNLSTDFSSGTGQTSTLYWGNYKNVERAPDVGKVHIVVSDVDGVITGSSGTVLEVFENVSVTSTAKTEDGSTNFYKNVVNNTSKWLFATQDDVSAIGTDVTAATYSTLASGADGDDESTVSLADLAVGYDLYISPEDIDISLVLQGKATSGANDSGLANYIINNICDVRRDCIAFVSPAFNDVVNVPGREVDNILAFRNSMTVSSYAVIDSGYKYRYDKYNDVFRYTPLNGDIAGTVVRTDTDRDPWFSPAGFSRGVIKNVVKLAFNPNRAQRDILYPKDVNPVITQPGQGTILFGDKTALGRASAFDRINVRRLFIVLEKAIARASKTTLFEFNDEFTRAQFRNLVEPFLRDVQGRRGIYDFRVIVDETNNTPEVIDSNRFVGDIYIKPARSINFIQLNFVAVRTGVEFNEIVGA
ncbi:MAG: hypothetical protein COA84_13225 [Robiginitomaculum sp.]|nr:MAG: hypothetical protein COA84_13225 [Robiginitomaculum sp.]